MTPIRITPLLLIFHKTAIITIIYFLIIFLIWIFMLFSAQNYKKENKNNYFSVKNFLRC